MSALGPVAAQSVCHDVSAAGESRLGIRSSSVGQPTETCLCLRRHDAGLGGDQAIVLDAPVAGEIEHGFLAETRRTLVSRTMSASGESRLTSAEQAGGV
jgi:hypothetical protein